MLAMMMERDQGMYLLRLNLFSKFRCAFTYRDLMSDEDSENGPPSKKPAKVNPSRRHMPTLRLLTIDHKNVQIIKTSHSTYELNNPKFE